MSTNVIDMTSRIAGNKSVSVNPFPQESKLYFDVQDRLLTFFDNNAHEYVPVTSHKALVTYNQQQLAIVGKGYKTVQNKELFQGLELQMMDGFKNNELEGVQVKDRMAYHGATCLREYIFPNVQVKVDNKSDVAFRVVALNGFGGSAIKLYAGAIDFFCTNGMVTGDFDASYFRHTRGLELSSITQRLRGAIDIFYKQQDIWQGWTKKTLDEVDVKEILLLMPNMSERRAEQLFRQYLIEARVRGDNVWALYSAMTYFSTHSEGEFKVKNTVSDHNEVTLHKREEQVLRWTQCDAFKAMAA